MRRLLFLTAAVLAAVVFFLLATLPPTPVSLSLEAVDADLLRRTVRGAYHIHTTRSDGAEDKATVAHAASRAGLNFAIFTEHGDGTRAPDPPAYVDGVLCIDGIEISTNGGHYVALGMAAAPYPLGGEAAAVVEDVRRLGGFGIAAHPDSPKPELAWRDRTAPIDAVEWLSADSEWRAESGLALARTAFDYLFRPAPALASVLDRPQQTIDWWDAASRARRVVALAAVDAHGGGRTASREEGERRVVIGPSYEASFRSLTNRVVLERPLTGDAAADAGALLDAIRSGSVYSVVDAISPDVVVDVVDTDPGRLRVLSPLPAGAEVETVADADARRLEVRVPHAPGEPPIPWVLTNWVYAGRPSPSTNPAGTQDVMRATTRLIPRGWIVEKDPSSEGHLAAVEGHILEEGGDITLSYRLADGARNSQYVAAAADLDEASRFDTVVFRGRASRPMRVSVQLRFRPNDSRWMKSVYLDTHEREISIPLSEMVAAEPSGAPMPPAGMARSLLFVVDLVNARPGASGQFTISDLRVAER